MARRRQGSAGRSRTQAHVPRTSRPIAGAAAFRNVTERNHVLSQAATLLLIGSHLRGDQAALRARAEASGRLLHPVARRTLQAIPSSDLRHLEFPRLAAGAPRLQPESLQRMAGVRFAATPAPVPAPGEARTAAAALRRAASAFYRYASHETAGALVEVALRHPQELVRVAAAASYFPVAVNPSPAIAILARGARSHDRLTREVAATALARIDPSNPALAPLLAARPRRSTRRRSRTSLLVHGTWARTAAWWQPPSGDFWQYVHADVEPNLYGAQDRFDWSGGYSVAARALGGARLAAWVQQHNLAGLDLFAHSHGGSVSMVASQAGTQVGRMILLSCPVHWPQYTPAFNRVNRVVSIRVHLDLVILADGGGQRFYDPRIEEHVLPLWFDHALSHDPATWRQYNVPAWL
jgi:hypothetical protein